MASSTTDRRDAIRLNQTQLLYESVVFSAVGSFAAAIVVLATFGPYTDSRQAWIWYFLINLAYVMRLVDFALYRAAGSAMSRSRHWNVRFKAGAVASSLAWASSLWLIFPQDNQSHQVLLILTLGGVAGGALASLPYDRWLNTTFQLLIVCSVETRLLLEGDRFALELALFSFFVFGFLLSCGEKVARNYLELLRLKQDALENNLTLIKTTERMARIGYWQWDMLSSTVELSENLALMWGFTRRRVSVSDCFRRLHKDDRRRVRRAIESVLHRKEEAAVEHQIVDRSGNRSAAMRQVIKPIEDSDNRTHWLGTVQDISDIRTAEQTIYRMAYFDDLTELANRASFHEHLQAMVDQCTRSDQEFTVIYVDLDDFKGVNDSFGHACGDQYLRVFARHLAQCCRRPELIARLGGDEFCVLLYDATGGEDARRTAEAILEFSQESVQIGNHRIYPKLSIGISMFPRDGKEPDEIIRSADLAMYNVKRNGKHHYAFYTSDMGADAVETARLEADFRKALTNNEFELWYQPQIALQDNSLSGVEALIRWRHPVRGLVSPDVFISLAERVGMINDIGEWVLEEACRQLAVWKRQGYRLQMAVNISGIHFTSEGFCSHVVTTMRRHQLASGELEIEITESLSRNPQEHYRICHELREAGIRVAIDDFGTGYSSLSVLQNLGVNVLKIDRSFISGLPRDRSSRLLVGAITEMALGLGYELVAEGVENREQLDYLKALRCTHVQGYLFSKPVQPGVIPHLIDMGEPLTWAA